MEAARIQPVPGFEPGYETDEERTHRGRPAGPGADPLRVVASRFRPITLATDQIVPVLGPLGEVLPDGGLRRGTVLTLEGATGTGTTTLALDLAAAVTATGQWAAMVQLASAPSAGSSGASSSSGASVVGAPAAVEAGVALDRLAVIRHVPRDRWSVVVAALVEGVALVITDLPPHVRLADTRRIVARTRERGSILVALGAWPERAAVRLRPRGGTWRMAGGRLDGRDLTVDVEGRGRPVRRVQVA